MHNLEFDLEGQLDIAKSVQDVATLKNPIAKAIMDRSVPLTSGVIDRVLDLSIFDWSERSPKPVFDKDGNFLGTDLDMLTLLSALHRRKAVVSVPNYRARRGSVEVESERRVADEFFGNITGLISNKDVFSFSVRLFDHSVVQRSPDEVDSVGAHRNYMIADVDGSFYEGFNRLKFDPTKDENQFLREYGVLGNYGLECAYVVHPNRKQSVLGAPYLLLKMLTARINDEISFNQAEVKRLREAGVRLPPKRGLRKERKTSKVGNTTPKQVETMEMILDMPEFRNEYPRYENTSESLQTAMDRAHNLTYRIRPRVQFVVRADEAAFFLYGAKDKFTPKWIKESWNEGFRPPRGRRDWNQMILGPNTALRYRLKTVTQQVAA